LGDNIIKSLYIWNESDNKSEPLTTYRLKLEECILTKNDILSKYKNAEPTEVKEKIKPEEEWSFNLE